MLGIKHISRITVFLFFNKASFGRVAIKADGKKGYFFNNLAIGYLLV